MWKSQGISEKTTEFCNGVDECFAPKIPNCEDRTILCLDQLPVYEDMIQTNLTSNDTLYQNSLGAKFGYSCKNPGYCSFDKDIYQCTSLTSLMFLLLH